MSRKAGKQPVEYRCGERMWGTEIVDVQAGFPTIEQEWKERFGDVLDTKKARHVEDLGDTFVYHMPNGYYALYSCGASWEIGKSEAVL